jgi:multiple sugar transport system substrate-binding protein
MGVPIRLRRRIAAALASALVLVACRKPVETRHVVTFPGSSVGAEGKVLRAQVARFEAAHPDIRVDLWPAPDAADQRRQLYVQWLAADSADPDVLQLDVIWTPEFAAAGWLLPLDAFGPRVDDFFPAALEADRWDGRLYALPWFVDVGMLYWRTDLVKEPPRSYAELVADARAARTQAGPAFGLVWPAARYEGLVTVFLEYLGAFGGRILDGAGRVAVDSPAAVRALEAMRDALASGLAPKAALAWHEEETRFAFQNGKAVFMCNWPYAYALMADPARSQVAGHYGITTFPAADADGRPTAALGGSQLAVNARSDEPAAAWALVAFLTAPAQMLERARVAGQLPARRSLYAGDELATALPMPPATAAAIVEHAVARPVTPVYAELSELLQVRLHRVLSGQESPREALTAAAREMRDVLARARLPEASHAGG